MTQILLFVFCLKVGTLLWWTVKNYSVSWFGKTPLYVNGLTVGWDVPTCNNRSRRRQHFFSKQCLQFDNDIFKFLQLNRINYGALLPEPISIGYPWVPTDNFRLSVSSLHAYTSKIIIMPYVVQMVSKPNQCRHEFQVQLMFNSTASLSFEYLTACGRRMLKNCM